MEDCSHVGIGVDPIIDSSQINNTILESLRISDCNFLNNNVGIFNYLKKGSASVNNLKDIMVENCTFENNLFGLNHSFTDGGFIKDCNFVNNGGESDVGTTSLLLQTVSNINIEKVSITNTQRVGTNTNDGCGLDFEGNCHNVTVDDCSFEFNDGAGIMLFDNSVENTNISIINNSFIRNNVDPDNTNPYGEFYEILFRSVVGGGKPAPTGTINNNYFLLENSTGYYGTDTGTPLSGFSVYDNTVENY